MASHLLEPNLTIRPKSSALLTWYRQTNKQTNRRTLVVYSLQPATMSYMKIGTYLEGCVVLVTNTNEVRHSSHIILHAGTQRYCNLLTTSRVVLLISCYDRWPIPAHSQHERSHIKQPCSHCLVLSFKRYRQYTFLTNSLLQLNSPPRRPCAWSCRKIWKPWTTGPVMNSIIVRLG